MILPDIYIGKFIFIIYVYIPEHNITFERKISSSVSNTVDRT